MNMTPEQRAAIQSLRDAGYALTVYSPEELRGANPQAVENRVGELGNEVLDVLAIWIDPDMEDVTEVELQYDLDGQLLSVIKTDSAEPIDPQKINQAGLSGSYVHEVVVEHPYSEDSMKKLQELAEFNVFTNFKDAKATLIKMGMGYGGGLKVESRDGPEVRVILCATIKNSALVETESQSSRWNHMGDAGEHKVWVRRATAPHSLDPINIYQCLPGAKPPSDTSGGYPVLDSLLSLKGLSKNFRPNKFYPPEGYLCASEYTKDLIPGALYETVLGKVSEGYARYDMTITHDGKAFVPVHGNAKMAPCATALEAAQNLRDYWEGLPDSSKNLYRPPATRPAG